jgi:hypothetical protein
MKKEVLSVQMYLNLNARYAVQTLHFDKLTFMKWSKFHDL